MKVSGTCSVIKNFALLTTSWKACYTAWSSAAMMRELTVSNWAGLNVPLKPPSCADGFEAASSCAYAVSTSFLTRSEICCLMN